LLIQPTVPLTVHHSEFPSTKLLWFTPVVDVAIVIVAVVVFVVNEEIM